VNSKIYDDEVADRLFYDNLLDLIEENCFNDDYDYSRDKLEAILRIVIGNKEDDDEFCKEIAVMGNDKVNDAERNWSLNVTSVEDQDDGTALVMFDVDDNFVAWFKDWQGLKRWSQKRFQRVMHEALVEYIDRESHVYGTMSEQEFRDGLNTSIEKRLSESGHITPDELLEDK